MRAITWEEGDIVVIDQSRLPLIEETLRLADTEAVAEAIRALRVRGAPALGIAGAMGVAQAALRPPTNDAKEVLRRAGQAADTLAETRPTAANLRWGIERVLARGRAAAATRANGLRVARAMAEEALAIQEEDEKACLAMADHAQIFFSRRAVVLTHCNTGSLCTGGHGTALGAIRRAHDRGLGVAVLATETRPLLQGARLTAWELGRLGIPHAVVVDSAAPGLIARGEVTLVVVGADRIAANGDVANKVGTYPLALAAHVADVPFVVVAPTSTVDLGTPDGSKIEMEERAAEEVTTVLGMLQVAPEGTSALNPAFDLTPASLVTAIVTERGVARPPFERSLARLLGAKRAGAARGARPARPRPAPPRRATAKKEPSLRAVAASAKTRKPAVTPSAKARQPAVARSAKARQPAVAPSAKARKPAVTPSAKARKPARAPKRRRTK